MGALEPFKFRQFVLGGRFHVPLPKMIPRQMEMIRRRLESVGLRTAGMNPLRASKAGVKIVVDPAGLCSSNQDLSDTLAPMLPEILASEPTRVPLRALRNLYFASERRGSKVVLRLSPRLESESYWDELRLKGNCALTPDERAVYSAVLSSRTTLASLVTDFPTEGSAARRIGRRQYFDSWLGPRDAAATLRGLGPGQARNTYLPRDSLLSMSPTPLSKEELSGLFGGLGDWCFFSLK